MRSLVVLAFAAVVTSGWAGQTIFGLKNAASAGGSAPPTRLFSFDGTTGAVTDVGDVSYQGQGVNADALAFDGNRLLAFLLEANGSRLVQIDSTTAVATSLAFFDGTEMRGATYRNGRLYTLDVTEDVHNRSTIIDLADYSTITANLDTRIANGCDLDFDASGTLWVAESNAFHTLDPLTGVLTFVAADQVQQSGGFFVYNPGFAFDETVPGRAVVFEANGTDDLNSYVMPVPSRTSLNTHIFPGFNAGRGDLAAVPEPGSLLALGLGAVLLRRRRTR